MIGSAVACILIGVKLVSDLISFGKYILAGFADVAADDPFPVTGQTIYTNSSLSQIPRCPPISSNARRVAFPVDRFPVIA